MRTINASIDTIYRECPDGEHESVLAVRYNWTAGTHGTREDPGEPDELEILYIQEISLWNVKGKRTEVKDFKPRMLFQHDFEPDFWRHIEEKCHEDAVERWYEKSDWVSDCY